MAREDLYTVKVFQESPLWDKYERWFLMPQADIRRLHVVTWECHEDHARELTERLHAEYPNHVLVYATMPGA